MGLFVISSPSLAFQRPAQTIHRILERLLRGGVIGGGGEIVGQALVAIELVGVAPVLQGLGQLDAMVVVWVTIDNASAFWSSVLRYKNEKRMGTTGICG